MHTLFLLRGGTGCTLDLLPRPWEEKAAGEQQNGPTPKSADGSMFGGIG